jgi:hypothetical protein
MKAPIKKLTPFANGSKLFPKPAVIPTNGAALSLDQSFFWINSLILFRLRMINFLNPQQTSFRSTLSIGRTPQPSFPKYYRSMLRWPPKSTIPTEIVQQVGVDHVSVAGFSNT